MYGDYYKFLRGKFVHVNDVLVSVPYRGPNTVDINIYGDMLVFTSSALNFDWDGYQSASLAFYKGYLNKLCGLCTDSTESKNNN